MSGILKISAKKKVNIKELNSFQVDVVESKEKKEQSLIDTAYSEGYEKGYLKCKEELENTYTEKVQKRMKELNEITSHLNNSIRAYEESFEKIVLELSFLISEKIIKEKLEKNSRINETLALAMKKVIGANDVIIKINPDDLKGLSNENKNILNDTSYSKIKFEPDEKIEPGGCLIETDIGNVDGRVNAQLKEIKRMLESLNVMPEM